MSDEKVIFSTEAIDNWMAKTHTFKSKHLELTVANGVPVILAMFAALYFFVK